VLRAIPPIESKDVIIGQYVASGDKPGYLDDPTVPKGSQCVTFAALVLHIKSERWDGVPFILKAGKGTLSKTPHIPFRR
jgi:glucose-6-phosphate 1-dehydrogenase